METKTPLESKKTDAAIRDASTVIAVKDPKTNPSILMGQRGKGAAFMPNKFVFPGGRVDADDNLIPLTSPIAERCRNRLESHPTDATPNTLAVAAIRELWEETGLVLGSKADWHEPPEDWAAFANTGHRPDASPLSFFFRALTPPGRPRRFDARFFIVDTKDIANDIAEMPAHSDELSHLQWVPLAKARDLDLAFITKIVLSQLAHHLPSTDPPQQVPFVRNDEIDSRVIWL